MAKKLFEAVYVWEAPVRFFHWVTVLCILTLAATGYLIGSPPALLTSQEAWRGYWFGTARFLHFAAAYVLVFTVIFRIYWAFAGNRFARWSNYLPLRREQWREMAAIGRKYLLISPRHRLPLGNNILAAVTYLLVVLVMVFQAVTGFGLYSAMSKAWLPALFAWVVPLAGADMAVRQWHHLMLWVFVVFLLIHVYLAIFNDRAERQGLFSAIVSGWKFVERP